MVHRFAPSMFDIPPTVSLKGYSKHYLPARLFVIYKLDQLNNDRGRLDLSRNKHVKYLSQTLWGN